MRWVVEFGGVYPWSLSRSVWSAKTGHILPTRQHPEKARDDTDIFAHDIIQRDRHVAGVGERLRHNHIIFSRQPCRIETSPPALWSQAPHAEKRRMDDTILQLGPNATTHPKLHTYPTLPYPVSTVPSTRQKYTNPTRGTVTCRKTPLAPQNQTKTRRSTISPG